MKILGICGSHREESNTNKIVKKVVESSGYEFELLYMGQMDIRPCTGCYQCMMNEGQCHLDDDMQPLYDKLMNADAIVFGSPTYYVDISGAAKCLIDRTMALYYRGIGPDAEIKVKGQRPLAGRIGIPVTTVGGRGHERSLETLRIYFQENKMNIVAELAEVVGMKDVDDMPEVLQRAEKAGKKLGEALRNR